MRATVLHSAHIGKTASRITYGEIGSGIAFEEKQSRILFIRIFRFQKQQLRHDDARALVISSSV